MRSSGAVPVERIWDMFQLRRSTEMRSILDLFFSTEYLMSKEVAFSPVTQIRREARIMSLVTEG